MKLFVDRRDIIDKRADAEPVQTIYKEQGIDGLVENNYQGSHYKLSEEQIEVLKKELNSRMYPTAESIGEYAWKTFRIQHTVKGMVQTLHRLGYA